MATPSSESGIAPGYEFHVFLSYRRGWKDEDGRSRDDDVEIWVRDFLERELQRKLTHELEVPPARLFLDRFEIRAGDEWERTLANALRTSQCIVPVWSPMYFRSRWCVSEWASFLSRPTGLVVPVLFQGQRALPEAAKRIQFENFTEFNYTSPSFRLSPKYLDFEDMVGRLARRVARAVKQAPDFDPNWSIVLPEPNDALGELTTTCLSDLPNINEIFVEGPPQIGRATLRAA